MEWLNILKLVFVAVFLVLGVFGNVQLVSFFLAKRDLRNKTSFLLFLNAAIHLVCLTTRPINITIALTMETVPKTVCITFSTIYLTAMSLQAWATFFMAVDLMLKLSAPFSFRLVTTKKFALIVFGVLMIPLIFNLCVHYVGLQHEIVGKRSCSALLLLTHNMQILWVVVQEVAVVTTLVIYIAAIVLLRIRVDLSKHVNQQSLKSVIVILGCFTFLCMFGVSAELYLELADITEEHRIKWISLVMLHMFICFSQNFYICLWRSSSCRSAFKSNMDCLMCIGNRSKYAVHSNGSHGTSSRLGDSSHPGRKQTLESDLHSRKSSF